MGARRTMPYNDSGLQRPGDTRPCDRKSFETISANGPSGRYASS